MKRLLNYLVFSLLILVAHGQNMQPVKSWGFDWPRGAFDSVCYLPTGCGAPSGTASLQSYGVAGQGQLLRMAAIFFDSCGHTWYGYDPTNSTWTAIGSGGSANKLDSIRQHAGTDSVFGWVNGTLIFQYKNQVTLANILNGLGYVPLSTLDTLIYVGWAHLNKTIDSMKAVNDARYLQRTNNLSDLTSANTARGNLGLGTSATHDVPPSGDASAAQVVLGNDSRLGSSYLANGLSVIGGHGQLGQPVGQSGDPAKLTANGEIPLNGNSLAFPEKTLADSGTVILNDTADHGNHVVPIKIRKKRTFGYFQQYIPFNYGVTYNSGYRPGTGDMRSGIITSGYESNTSGDAAPDNIFNLANYNEDAQGNIIDTSDAGMRVLSLEGNFLNVIGGIPSLGFELHMPEVYTFNHTRIRTDSKYIRKTDGYCYNPLWINETAWNSVTSGNQFASLVENNNNHGIFQVWGNGGGDDPDGELGVFNISTGFRSWIRGYNTNIQIGHSGNGNSSLQPFIINHSGDVIFLNNPSTNPADWRGAIVGQDNIRSGVSSNIVFEARGITKAMLFPRMTTAQFAAIPFSGSDTGAHAQFVDHDYKLGYTNGSTTKFYATEDQLGSQVAVGEYMPTGTLTTNAASVAFDSSHYVQSGYVVDVTGIATITPSASGICEVTVDIPVASNLRNSGTGLYGDGMGFNFNPLVVYIDFVNKKAVLRWNAPSTSNDQFRYHFRYIVE